MNRKFIRNYFKEKLSNIVFIVTFDQFNAPLMKKSINSLKKSY